MTCKSSSFSFSKQTPDFAHLWTLPTLKEHCLTSSWPHWKPFYACWLLSGGLWSEWQRHGALSFVGCILWSFLVGHTTKPWNLCKMEVWTSRWPRTTFLASRLLVDVLEHHEARNSCCISTTLSIMAKIYKTNEDLLCSPHVPAMLQVGCSDIHYELYCRKGLQKLGFVTFHLKKKQQQQV